MKAMLEIELIGDNIRQMSKEYTELVNNIEPGLGDATFGTLPSSEWVAEITGKDPFYKYARSFLTCKKDYSRANSVGSRGVYAEYLLESGKYYEVKSRNSWRGECRYFCTVNDEGDIVKIEETELIEALEKVNPSRFDKKLGISINESLTEYQKKKIVDRRLLELNKIAKVAEMLCERLPENDLIKSFERQRFTVENPHDFTNIGLWAEMERAMTDFNHCADIVKAPLITHEYILKGVRKWLKNRSESMSSPPHGNE